MNALIHVATPQPAGAAAARISYATGRSLTANDFARQDRYWAQRLLDLSPATPGVLSGLGVSPPRYDSADGTTGLASLSVAAGFGYSGSGRLVRVSAPLVVQWSDLAALASPGGTLPDGIYMLTAQTAEFDMLEGPPPDPAVDTTLDPLLDEREESYVELALSAVLGPLPADRTPAGIALGLNSATAALGSASAQAAIGDGVPLALCLSAGGALVTLSQAAGRIVVGVSGALLAQTREALAMALAETGAAPGDPGWQRATAGRFAALPPAGELPLGFLQNPALATASCPFFPPGMAVALCTVRASQAAALVERALGRAPVDLDRGVAESVALALAIPDALWAPGLLDLPRADPVLAADTHLSYALAAQAQANLVEDFAALYAGVAAPAGAVAQAIGFLSAPDSAAAALTASAAVAAAAVASDPVALSAMLTGNLAPPATPPNAALILSQAGYGIADPDPSAANPAATGSDAVLAALVAYLPPNSAYADWVAAIQASPSDPVLLLPLVAAGVVDPAAATSAQAAAIQALLAPAPASASSGAVLALAVLQMFYAVVGRVAQAQEATLLAHDRLLALQRMHLDVMSTSVSSLAGGVPPDGTGLQFTRIIPFYTLQNDRPPVAAAAPAVQTNAGVSRVFRSGIQSFQLDSLTVTAAPTTSFSVAQIAPITRALAPSSVSTRLTLRSAVPSLLNRQPDVAAQVATEVSAISQSPPISFDGVTFGRAVHITPGGTHALVASTGVTALQTAMGSLNLSASPYSATLGDQTASAETVAYSSVLDWGRTLLTDMGTVETSAQALQTSYNALREALQSLDALIDTATQAVAAARDTLRTAQAAAAAQAANYAAAQRLVAEELARVNAATVARNGAIGAATGLFYTRALQTAFVRDPAASLSLVADTAADIVPGCDGSAGGPPACVQPFVDALVEVPLGDWRPLRDRWGDLPDTSRILSISAARQVRLANWSLGGDFGGGAASGDLAELAAATRSVFEPMLRATVTPAASLAATQRAALAVFAYPDIITLPWQGLRAAAEALRARMESAAGCLYQALTALPPSVRFAVAAQARDGTLAPLNVAAWPMPASLSGATAAASRRIAALIGWMGQQMDDASSTAGQTALRQCVAALVVASAYGDPDDALAGSVTSAAPTVVGQPIRVVLNRRPPIGTRLDLLDGSGSVAASVAVEDHDGFGTLVRVVSSAAGRVPDSTWSVAGQQGSPRRLLT